METFLHDILWHSPVYSTCGGLLGIILSYSYTNALLRGQTVVSEPEIQDTPEQLQVLHPTVQTLSTLYSRLEAHNITNRFNSNMKVDSKQDQDASVNTFPLQLVINPIYCYPIADEKRARIHRNKKLLEVLLQLEVLNNYVLSFYQCFYLHV